MPRYRNRETGVIIGDNPLYATYPHMELVPEDEPVAQVDDSDVSLGPPEPVEAAIPVEPRPVPRTTRGRRVARK